jgi:uncharacterized protein involved in oxidation of intracellular sulfur
MGATHDGRRSGHPAPCLERFAAYGLVVKTLFILNDAPYGTEKSYNGLRLALALAKLPDHQIRIFLMADAVFCGRRGQKTPDGYYNIERMLRGCATKRVEIGACGSCADARGVADAEFIDGVRRSTMAELAEWTVAADKVLVW